MPRPQENESFGRHSAQRSSRSIQMLSSSVATRWRSAASTRPSGLLLLSPATTSSNTFSAQVRKRNCSCATVSGTPKMARGLLRSPDLRPRGRATRPCWRKLTRRSQGSPPEMRSLGTSVLRDRRTPEAETGTPQSASYVGRCSRRRTNATSSRCSMAYSVREAAPKTSYRWHVNGPEARRALPLASCRCYSREQRRNAAAT